MPSPEAELGLPDWEGFYRYVYPGITYARMKLHWAKPNPISNPVIGVALPEDKSNLAEKFAPI